MLGKVKLKSAQVQEVDDLLEELRRQGLDLFQDSAPSRPVLPGNLGELTGGQLAQLLGDLTAYKSFAYTRYSVEKARLNQYQNQLKLLEAELMLGMPEGMSEAKKKAAVKHTRAYIDLSRKILNQKNKVQLIESGILTPVEQDIKTVSRIITIWESENDNHRRVDNAGRGKRRPKILDSIRSDAAADIEDPDSGEG